MKSSLLKCMLVLTGFASVLIITLLVSTRTENMSPTNDQNKKSVQTDVHEYTTMDIRADQISETRAYTKQRIHERYLVIGAISYPGYIISRVLKANKCNYRITEDISSLGFDLGTWNNYDELVKIGITPSIVDYSFKDVVKSELKWLGNNGTLIYIPSLLFNTNTAPFDVEYTSSIMENFINILKRLSEDKERHTKVLFLMLEGTSVQANAVRQFSLILSSYAHFYSNINYSFISIQAGNFSHNQPLWKWYCEMMCMQLAMEIELVHCNTYWLNCTSPSRDKAHQEDRQLEKRNFVTTTYFTLGDSMFKKDSFQFMKGFFMTAAKQQLDVLIFYDDLGDYFMNEVKDFYSKVEFVKQNDMKGRQKNDARFYILYEYLLQHPNIGSIVLQDLRDGIYTGDPFKVMDIIGSDLIYVGLDKAFDVSAYDNSWMSNPGHKFKHCYPKEAQKDQIHYHPFYNAGTIGGTRDVLLTFLTRLLRYLDKAPHDSYGCDMPTVCAVTHNHFFNHSFSGYPFQIYFASSLGPPPGLAVKHKDTQYV